MIPFTEGKKAHGQKSSGFLTLLTLLEGLH